MTSERKSNVIIATQLRYAQEHMPIIGRRPLTKIDFALRDMTFGAIPHQGAQVLAAYCMAENLNPRLVSLNDPRLTEMLPHTELALISFMDIAVDKVINLVKNNPNTKIILGGYGIPSLPIGFTEEHKNATVVLGEAEGILKKILIDYKNKDLKSIYSRSELFNLQNSSEEPYLKPKFRDDVLKMFRNSQLKTVEASRGCAEGCDFCPTARLNIRNKPLETLISEIDSLNLKPWEVLFFVDQNLLNLPLDYLNSLFSYINSNDIKWIGEGTISYLLNKGMEGEKVIEKMGKNCLTFLSGVEDFKYQTRGSAVKNELSKDIKHVVKELKKLKIPMLYSGVIGTDLQEKGYGSHAANIVNELGMTFAMHLVTPRPGTPFWNRVVKEDRLIDTESSKRNMRYHLVHSPSKMSRDQTLKEFHNFQNIVYNPKQIAKRFTNNLLVNPSYASGLLIPELVYLLSTKTFENLNRDIIK